MKTQTFNKTIIAIALCSMGFLAVPAMAAQDEFQHQLTLHVIQAREKLQNAKAAQGEERQKLMDEHMKMMTENMDKCAAMKPKTGLSAQERDEWFSEHQKLMKEIMDQMMEEHQMMMGMNCMPMNSGSIHKQ